MITQVKEEEAKKVITYDLEGKENGWLMELFKDGDKTVAYLTAAIPGAFKGYHMHRVRAARYVCLKGTMNIILYVNGKREEHLLTPGKRLFIPKDVPTGLHNIGDEESLLINYPDPPYDPSLKDEQVDFTEEELEKGKKYHGMITCNFEDGGKAQLRHVVVHCLVAKEEKLLLVKRTGPILETGKWSLPSGFLNRDETASECALRELKEETGWDGQVVKLFRIITKPDRPHEDRQNIALEFMIKPLEETGTPDHENSKVEWVPIEKLLPFEEFAFDHGETIKLYLEYRKKEFPLPLFV